MQCYMGHSEKVINEVLIYHFGTVALTVNSGRSLRWSFWGLVLSAMPELFAHYEYVGFDFIILVNNAPHGLGSLTWRP